jgi:hypothetical protein
MTFPLPDPDIQTGPWDQVKDGVQRNFDALAGAVVSTGGQRVGFRFSAGTLTFTASATSAASVISHGLGNVPIVVIACEVTTGFGVIVRTNTYTSTTFSAVGTNPFGAGTYVATFAWIAIG